MSDKYLKVIDHPELVRDTKSKAILNVDSSGLNKYKEERNFRMKLQNVVEDNDQIKKDISEIKELLERLIKKQ
jgi:hypothetical protein